MLFRFTCFLIFLSQSWVASQAQDSKLFGGLGIVMEMSQNGIRVSHVSEAAIAAGSPLVAGDIILGLGEAEQEFDEFKDSDLDYIRFKLVGPLSEPIGLHVTRGTERKYFLVNRLPLEDATVATLFLSVNLKSLQKDESVAASALSRFKQTSKSISYRRLQQIFGGARHLLLRKQDYQKAVHCCDLEEDCYTQRYGEDSPEVHEVQDSRAYCLVLDALESKDLLEEIAAFDAKLTEAERAQDLFLVEETSSKLIAILEPLIADKSPLKLAVLRYRRAANLYRLKDYQRSEEICLGIVESLMQTNLMQSRTAIAVYSLLSHLAGRKDVDDHAKHDLAIGYLRKAQIAQKSLASTSDIENLQLRQEIASAELAYAMRNKVRSTEQISILQEVLLAATNKELLGRESSEIDRFNLIVLIENTCQAIVSGETDPLLRLQTVSAAINSISSLDPDAPELSSLLNRLGTIYFDVQSFQDAASAFRRALDLRREERDPTGSFRAKAFCNLCSAKYGMGDRSEKLLLELRLVEELISDQESPAKADLVQVTRMVALVASELGKHEEAVFEIEKVLSQTDDKKSIGFCQDLHNYARILSVAGNHDEAQRQFKLSVQKMKQLGLGVAAPDYSKTAVAALAEEFHFGDRKLALAAFEQLAEEFLERFESASPESTDEEFDSMLAAGKEFMRMRLGMPFRIVPGIQEAARSPLAWSNGTENDDSLYQRRMYTRLLRFRKILFDRRIISERGRLARTRLAEFDREVLSLTQKLKSLGVESDERFEVVSKLASIAETKEEVISTLSKPVAHKGRQIDNPLNFILDEIGENEILVDFFLVDNAWADVGTRPDNVTEEQWESRLNQELWVTIAAKDFFFIDKLGNFAEIFEQFALFGSMLNETPFESSHPGRKASDMIFVEALLNIEGVDYDKADLIFCGEILPFLYPLQALPVPGEDAYLLERVRSVSVFSSPLNYFESKSRKFSNNDKQLLVIEDRSRDLAAGKREAEYLKTLELDNQPVFEKVETRFAEDGDWNRLAASIGEGTHIVVIGHGKTPLPGEFPADRFEFSNRRRIVPKSNFIGMIGESQAVAVPKISPALLERVDMSDCRLAVFSGCETAIDSVLAYDSPESLQMAALFAGCKASIGTLAEVYDEPSADLVSELFSEMFADKDLELSPKIALARAQKKLIVERRFDSKSLSLAKRDLKEGVPQPIQPDDGKKPDEVLQSKLPPLYWALYVAVDPG
jgi:tetratricopeptide (TPR) repeat protein